MSPPRGFNNTPCKPVNEVEIKVDEVDLIDLEEQDNISFTGITGLQVRSYNVTFRCVTLLYMLLYVTLCNITLCYFTLRYITLCYVMLHLLLQLDLCTDTR